MEGKVTQGKVRKGRVRLCRVRKGRALQGRAAQGGPGQGSPGQGKSRARARARQGKAKQGKEGQAPGGQYFRQTKLICILRILRVNGAISVRNETKGEFDDEQRKTSESVTPNRLALVVPLILEFLADYDNAPHGSNAHDANELGLFLGRIPPRTLPCR